MENVIYFQIRNAEWVPMKKKCYFLILLLCCFFLGDVSAKECNQLSEDNLKIFYAGDYDNPQTDQYCVGKNLRKAGCYPLTVASILASYGADVDVYDVRDYLCDKFPDDAQGTDYTEISVSSNFHEYFSMDMEKIATNLDDVNTVFERLSNALEEGKAVMISVRGGIYDSDSSGHYMAIPFKKGEQYYLLNTGSRYAEKYISEDTLKKEILGHVNAGVFSIIPTTCDNVSGGAEEPGRTEDPYPNIFPDVEGDHQGNVFFYSDGSATPFKEFLDGLFLLIRILTPILVIVLSTIDYIKAIASANQDDLKKTNQKTIKRVIIGLIVFFLPFLLELIFHLFGLYDISTGGIGQ